MINISKDNTNTYSFLAYGVQAKMVHGVPANTFQTLNPQVSLIFAPQILIFTPFFQNNLPLISLASQPIDFRVLANGVCSPSRTSVVRPWWDHYVKGGPLFVDVVFQNGNQGGYSNPFPLNF